MKNANQKIRIFNSLKKAINAKNEKQVYQTSRKLLVAGADQTAIFEFSTTVDGELRKSIIKAIIDQMGENGRQFIVQKLASLKRIDARVYMNDFLAAGGKGIDIAHWLQQAGATLLKYNIKEAGTAGNVIDAIEDTAEDLVAAIEDGIDSTLENIEAIIDALIDTGTPFSEVFGDIASWTSEQIQQVLKALEEAKISMTEFVSSVFEWSYASAKNFVRAAMNLGHTVNEILEIAIAQTFYIFRRFVNGIIAYTESVVDILNFLLTEVALGVDNIWKHALQAFRYSGVLIDKAFDWLSEQSQTLIEKFVVAWNDMGKCIRNFDLWDVSTDNIIKFINAMVNAGIKITEFVAGVFHWHYQAASNFVEAAFACGYTVLEILEIAVSSSYWVFRKFIFSLIKNNVAATEILDFILTIAENTVSTWWEDTLQALKYAEVNLLLVLDWMDKGSADVFESIIRAWESMGESLKTIYVWALKASEATWKMIGTATIKIGNSIYYVLDFLIESGFEFLNAFSQGVLATIEVLGELLVWAVQQSIEICGAIIQAAFDVEVTILQMVQAIMEHPGQTLNILYETMLSLQVTLDDLLKAVIEDTLQEFVEITVQTLYKMAIIVLDILEAVARVAIAALDTVLIILCGLLSTYRPINEAEIADATLVFGNTINYDLVYISTESVNNDIIFGIQDYFSKNENSRAFVTGNLINFDPEDDNFTRIKLIHEMTHIWQYRTIGGIYLASAINAQNSADGYNYGYNDENVAQDDILTVEKCTYSGESKTFYNLGSNLGVGGEDDLTDSNLPPMEERFDIPNPEFPSQFLQEGVFNLEQQGQIMMHWFARTQLTIKDVNGAIVTLDSSAFDPYQEYVFNS